MTDKLKLLVLVSVLAVLCASCATPKKVKYFQDSADGSTVVLPEMSVITLQPADKISILVNSKDPELASIFNLPVYGHITGNMLNTGFSNTANQVATYTVDTKGDIDFPVLGKLHVQGLMREQVAEMIKRMIVEKNYIKDPVVTVEFAYMYITVLGDVKNPGRQPIDKDRVTVLDAIAKAGDLNVTGQRHNVRVYREMDGRQVCYSIDLTSADNTFSSPAYYLRQDDVVYVDPNKMKSRQSTINGNNLLSTSFWISVGSLLTSVCSLIITAIKK